MAEYIEREAIHQCRFTQDERGEWILAADILAIPAADVVPVRHGRWKLGICQECLYDWSKVSLFANVPNYCPNCGAKMDKDGDGK